MQSIADLHPMDELKEELRNILDTIPPKSEVYYIDYPVHSNGGDMLIMKGTEAFFSAYDILVRARYSVEDFPKKLEIPLNCIIVMHGGGNFGDLYVKHQQLREDVVERYPNHRIVMMPQTIFYKSEHNFNRTANIFNRHSDLHLYVRDTLSFEMAKQKFKAIGVYLSPDMAHQLWPIQTSKGASQDTLYFLRVDIEKTSEQELLERSTGAKYQSKDWISLYTKLDLIILYAIIKGYRLFGGRRRSLLQKIWYSFSDYLVNKAVQEFSAYQTIHTSRLHGHILACLMNKSNVLLDNSYGKNTNYYQAWTSKFAETQIWLGSDEK